MKQFLGKNKFYLLSALLIVAVFGFRFVNLTVLPVFADEAIYIRWAQVMKAESTLRFLPLSDGKVPFFMWVIIPFLKFITDPLIAGRIVSVLSGFGTLAGVATLTWLLFKNIKVALIAAFIYAISPFAFFFDRLSLADSMLTMFGIWTFILMLLALSRNRLDFAMLAGFSLGGAWLTKSSALFFVLMLPFVWLMLPWDKKFKLNIKSSFIRLFLSCVTLVIGYGFYNILRLGPNFEMIARRNLDYVHPLGHILTSPLDPLNPFLLQSWEWYLMFFSIYLIAIFLLGYFVNYKKHLKEILVLSVWLFLPIVVQSEYAKVLTARYILFTLPYFVILASSAFLTTNVNLRKILLVLIVLFAGKSLVFNYFLITNPGAANLPVSERSGYLEEWTAGQGIKETADYLLTEYYKNPNEKIVIGTEGYFGTLPDGLQMYLNKHPQITVIGVGLNFSETPKSLIESYEYGNKTYLLINSDRYKGDPEKEGLELIKKYPKAERKDGTSQSLLFFKLTKNSTSL